MCFVQIFYFERFITLYVHIEINCINFQEIVETIFKRIFRFVFPSISCTFHPLFNTSVNVYFAGLFFYFTDHMGNYVIYVTWQQVKCYRTKSDFFLLFTSQLYVYTNIILINNLVKAMQIRKINIIRTYYTIKCKRNVYVLYSS